MKIDFVDLKTQYRELKASIDARIAKVLEHGQYILGPEVFELEGKLAAYVGSRHCIAVASGTDALLISLMALGIKPGDEVITTPFTFVATAEVAVLLGAKPVFVDIEEESFNIDAREIERAITERTRAIMPVSLYGQPADMDEINAIAAKRNIPVIEDAAQSFGAAYREKKSCNLSTIGCTSFFPSKPLGCYGDGGAIFTNDDALAKAMREIRVHGQEARYLHSRVGIGGRMDTLQCAIVLAKLERFDREIAQRQAAAARYSEMLADIADIRVPLVKPDRTSVWAQYTLRVPNREALHATLQNDGIPTAVHYPIPLYRQRAYAQQISLPITEKASREVLSLPMHADLTEETQATIVGALRRCSR